VAGGACRPSTWYLDKSLSEVSDFFPKSEAQALIKGCR